ncbi:lipase [Thermosyntropha sp.]|uniref:esterase/lipase family protein n=1 Tax=Thermosyntropha sp. TaxID=2740820 RepID=UPI0025EB5163|nr:lipase [Thermosyntropha sp.]MBO8158184.1 lipase [Thermosyntropha sp.]
MKKNFKSLAIFILSLFFLNISSLLPALAETATPQSGNRYPIVLVHGLGGFGRDEMLDFKYWGGLYDIQEYLKAHGYEVHTAAVGPVSSNWDRACELYAQLVGGTVDYGAAHAAKYGHARYGRTYKAFIPDLGKVDPETGEIKKVHLIGHSMGGQTIRTLVQLLEQGAEEERSYTQDNLSPLFAGGHSWVHSITTISTPHDGTSLDNAINKGMPWLQSFIGFMSTLSTPNQLYDLKLDQFGLTRYQGEPVDAYLKRVFESSYWKLNRDLSNWDLAVEGARELNGWVQAQENVYYFSWATNATRKFLFADYQVPKITMNLFLVPFALHIGSYTRNVPGQVPIDKTWWPNDGLVSLISQNGPKINSTDQIINYDGNPRRGVWNYMGVLEGYDHLDIIGIGTLWNPCPWYLKHAQLLASLPADYAEVPEKDDENTQTIPEHEQDLTSEDNLNPSFSETTEEQTNEIPEKDDENIQTITEHDQDLTSEDTLNPSSSETTEEQTNEAPEKNDENIQTITEHDQDLTSEDTLKPPSSETTEESTISEN